MSVEPPAGASGSETMHPLAQAFVDAHDKLAPKIAAQNTAHVVDLLEGFERDIGPLIAPIAQSLLDDPGTHDTLRPLLGVLAQPTHFGESVLIGVALGSILSPVLQSAFQPIVQGIANAAWSGDPTLPLSPDVLAAAVLKGVEDQGTAASEAGKSGVSEGAFGVMVKAAGNAIGIQEALLLYRRGQISAARLQAVEQYSNLNPAFYDMVPMLQYAPLSVGEVVTANLKGHLDDGTAATYLAHAGVDPQFQPLLKAASGRPPGLEQMLHLWNRNVATEADVDAAVRQSDINDAYLPFVKELRKYFPPPRSVVPMLRSGAITEAQARTLLTYYGVDAQWVDAFIKEAQTTKTTAGKDLTQAQIVRAYSVAQLTRAEAATKLTALGYDATEIGLLLDYDDAAKVERLTAALENKIGTLYVAHKLDKVGAQNALSDAGITNVRMHDLFAVWDIERTSNVHMLSATAIVGAYRREYIGPATTRTRLLEVGVLPADLGIVVADGWPPGKIAEAKAAADAVVNA